MSMVERVARAIADMNGDVYNNVPKHKSHWVDERGKFNGRFRDVNEPFKSDYDAMARAAIEAVLDELMEPGEGAYRAASSVILGMDTTVGSPVYADQREAEPIWQAILTHVGENVG